LEERQRIDAIRYLLSLGYDPNKIKIEAVVAKFGHGGKNSFRCDFAVLNKNVAEINFAGDDAVELLLKHAVILAEVKRDDSKADYVKKTQVEPLLKFAVRKDTIGMYWDGVTPRVFWKQEQDGETKIKSGPLALLPRPGRSINIKPLVRKDLLPPESLIDVFSRMEDILHAASISLEDRYETLLQFILAKIYDEHRAESSSKNELAFQDFESLGVSTTQTAKDLNKALSEAVGFYSAHLPKTIDDDFGLPDEILSQAGQILAPHLITAANKEVIQTFYMKFAKDIYRWDLAQYFTPPTVTDFVVEVLNPCAGEIVKDPACGSADFLVATFHRARARHIRNAAEMTFGADFDRKAVQISVLNMLLNGDGKTNIHEEDSLAAVAADRQRATKDKKFRPLLYHAVVCNPPFGVRIVEKRADILQWFDLGHVWRQNEKNGPWEQLPELLVKQEKGMLFAEVCVRQARIGGRIAIIVPNGYLGNRSDKYLAFREWLLRHCRVVSVCGFPRFTFKTSGADVSASILYLEKRETPLAHSNEDDDYMFNVELIENVGWSVAVKKPLPVFVREEEDGSFLVGEDGRKIVKSDFAEMLADIRNCPAISQFPWLIRDLDLPAAGKKKLGWAIPISTVLSDPFRTLDPKRHSRKYASLLKSIEDGPHVAFTDIFDIVPQGRNPAGTLARKKDQETYNYVDLDNIGAGDYQTSTMRGWQLPSRAKHFAGALDVYVGSIWSSVTKWCLISKTPTPNTVVTNGCHRLRMKHGKEAFLLDAAAFFCSESYATQMRALARGSDGLAEIHEGDLNLIKMPLIKNAKERHRLKPFIDALVNGRTTLKGTVTSMISTNELSLPVPALRPHHSALV